MLLYDVEEAFNTAPELSVDDILLNQAERSSFDVNIIHCIQRIIVNQGGKDFDRFKGDLETAEPVSDFKVDVHWTDIIPIPSFNIDESTIVGNAEVNEVVKEELELEASPFWLKIVRFFGMDQLFRARACSIFNLRSGAEAGYSGFSWGVYFNGLFHGKMTDATGTLFTHWGNPSSGPCNPGSLAFHNSQLRRLPIVLTSLPNFRTCRDLIFVSLYARILHCLLKVSGCESLTSYATQATWSTIEQDAVKIYHKFTHADVVDNLRSKRAAESKDGKEKATKGKGKAKPQDVAQPVTEGDMVFENAILFLRDALISREFTDAVKAGDSGRVLLVLKVWALSFRGSGRTKYAYEMLHLIHNLTHVWPDGIW